MTLKRGFKSQCERRSVELRKKLGLTPSAPLLAKQLANHAGVTVWSLENINGVTDSDLEQLKVIDPDSWSAFTLRIGNRHLIVFNSTQSPARENSVCMHELAHIILGHQLHDVQLSQEGHLVPSNFSKDQEDEADWFAGTLLLPRPALLDVRYRGLNNDEIREEYLVSDHMLNWRFRMTGVDYQLSNRRFGKSST